jgi:hypothetical protein
VNWLDFWLLNLVPSTVIQKFVFLSLTQFLRHWIYNISSSAFFSPFSLCINAWNCCCLDKHIYFESNFANYWWVAQYDEVS